MKQKLVIDIETTLDHETIHMAVVAEGDRSPVICWSAEQFQDRFGRIIDKGCTIIGHNIIGFDKPVMENVWGIDFKHCTFEDTMILSSLLEPEERHSLKECCLRHNKTYFKGDFETEDFDSPPTGEMVEYALLDVEATRELYKSLIRSLDDQDFSQYSRDIEHDVKHIVCQQERNGILFDVDKANHLYSQLCFRTNQIKSELQEVFPPIVTERYSTKTGKRLKDDVEEFNPNSRQQIAKRLQMLGVKFTKHTEKGNIIINEPVLAEIDLNEARILNESLMLSKRIGLLDGWFKHLGDDGRIHGRVRTNGAVTGRMTHSAPNLAQIPAVRSQYGKECRELFTVPEGKVMVGCDASGLELRMLAHYMQDEDYIKAVVEGTQEKGTDVHTRNMQAFGCEDRDTAKTLIYAMLYGAGDAKLGSIVGGSASVGKHLRHRFLSATPAYAELLNKVEKLAEKGSLPGLDGRRLWVRHQHAALNTLLQGAGAVVMKVGLCRAVSNLTIMEVPHLFLVNVHDEWQVETDPEYADDVGTHLVDGIRGAGWSLKLRCPLNGEYKIGDNWAATH